MKVRRSPPSRVLGGMFLLSAGFLILVGCVTVPATELLPRAGRESTGLLLIAHGYGNNPSHWPAKLIREIRGSGVDANGWDIYAHDWETQANQAMRAARSGHRIGVQMARELVARGDHYNILHLIGQSMGAHLTQGFVDEYRRLGGRALVYMTFMDPFLIRGVFGLGYGVRRFGKGADFAENFIVRHEPVLGTNRYLRHAYNTDVSALVVESLQGTFFGPHWWVVEYYRKSVTNAWPGFDRAPIAWRGAYGPTDMRTRLASLRSEFPPGERLILPSE